MKLIPVAVGLIALAVSFPTVRATESAKSDIPQYTSAQIRKMVREAHTAQQYTALSDYYATRQRMFRRNAAEAMHQWALRNEMINPLAEKWPRPVDSSRNRYQYYEYEAAQCGELSAKYSRLADAASEQASTAHPRAQ